MQIPGLRGLGPVDLIKRTVKEYLEDDMLTHASALAFQVFFSIFPFVIFLIALLGFLHLPELFDWLRQQAAIFLPGEVMDQVNQVIEHVQQPQGGLLSFGMIFAIWTASSAVRVMMNAMNAAYDVKEGRPAWKLYPLSIVYTIGIAAMLIAAAALMLIGPQAMQWLSSQIGFEQLFVTLWAWLRWPLILLLLTLAVAVVYYVAPDVEQSFRFITPGAIICVLIWIVAALGFNFYVQNFADYNATYGSIGTIIVLLTFFFLSSMVLLFGAQVNAVIEHLMPEGKDPGDKKLD